MQDALDIARCNGEGDLISVGAGTYDADAANTFVYSAAASENFPLTISGIPGGSIIDGMNNNGGMALTTFSASSDDQADMVVSGLVFQNGNQLQGSGGGLAVFVQDADVTVDRCSFLSNIAPGRGGGLAIEGSGESVQIISNTLFLSNTSSASDGGGVGASSGQGSITVVNNIVAQNLAEDGNGGGMFLNASSGNITATNNTFFNNDASAGNGGGLAAQVDDSESVFDIYNNIVFGNSAETNGDDIWTCEQGATVNLFNNDFTQYYSEALEGGFCGGTATLNQGANISDNPEFVDAAADDFHLQATSPAIDTGDPAAPSMPSTDFDGYPRPTGSAPDMGALEFQPTPSPTPNPSPTPTPIPTPVPTPTPAPVNLFVEGGGCAIQVGKTDSSFSTLFAFAGLGGFALLIRRKASSKID